MRAIIKRLAEEFDTNLGCLMICIFLPSVLALAFLIVTKGFWK